MTETTPLLVVVGPTASGKTALAVKLAEERGGEIVSADSVQVYRHFDIGSGKPSVIGASFSSSHKPALPSSGVRAKPRRTLRSRGSGQARWRGSLCRNCSLGPPRIGGRSKP